MRNTLLRMHVVASQIWPNAAYLEHDEHFDAMGYGGAR